MKTIHASFSAKIRAQGIRPTLKEASPFPELIPFINVFFLLLIFFVMGSSFVSVSAIPVSLPKTANAGIYSVKKYIVTVDDKGKIYFNDVIIESMDALKMRLLSDVIGIADGTGSIVLRADLRTNFGTVARIMALADELNINTFILAERNEEEIKTSFRDE